MENFKICKDCGRELPIINFKKTRFGGRAGVCTECATRKLRENKARKKEDEELKKEKVKSMLDNRKQMLSEFKPRELMEELARRGYKGKLSYTNVIDICNI